MSFVPDTQNKEFQDALNLIQYTRQSVFLTGKAGTGKSTFLKYICANTKKKHVVLAPTGIAAINAGGSTLHSFFKLPFYPLLPDDPNFSLQRGRIHEFFKYTKPHRKLLEELELVIIDEAHHAQARTYRMLWNWCPEAKFLGLTATPCRMGRTGFTDLFDSLVCSWSVAEFIRKGWLSSFDYVSIRANSREQRLIDSLEKRGADGDYQVREMNDVLNRHTSIDQLYRSVLEYADGKKGIVYAVSIDHARNIAAYYSGKGLDAAAIDSHTPAAERGRMVKDFKTGRIKVLVNVDVFSEGFDCPDVEFVQMARPTLSLAKYLQQAGRGLRKSTGKETCVLIDNVGLYRVFGLPTMAWDWEAMFRGDMAGRGIRTIRHGNGTSPETVTAEDLCQDFGMEMIVSHDRLLSAIALQKTPNPCKRPELRAWHDKNSGLWGLCRGRNKITAPVFVTVFDIGMTWQR